MKVPQIRRQASVILAVLALLTTQGERTGAQSTSAAATVDKSASAGATAAKPPSLKTTFVPLSNNANAVLLESPEPSPNQRIVAINTHPDHNNNFNYFIG